MKVVLFDLDGVLIDSENVNILAGVKSFKDIGINLSKKEQKLILGRHPADYDKIFKYKFDKKAMVARHHKHYFEFYKLCKVFPFVRSFVKSVQKHFKTGLVTSSDRYIIKTRSLKLLNLKFDKYITFEDCKKRKPAPDCYLLAAKKFKVKPIDCVVIEDSLPGVTAAKRAGMTCIAVASSLPVSVLKKHADFVVKNLNDKHIWRFLC